MIIGISGKLHSGKDTVGKMIQYMSSGIKHISYEDFFKETSDGRTYNLSPAELYSSNWEIKKFAGKLKQIASILTGYPVEKFEDQDFKDSFLSEQWNIWSVQFPQGDFYGEFATKAEAVQYEKNERRALQWPKSFKAKVVERQLKVREFLQRLGTECMRYGLHQNTWVNALFADYETTVKPSRKFHRSELFTEEGDDITFSDDYPNWIITDPRFPNEYDSIKERGGIIIRIDRGNCPKCGSDNMHSNYDYNKKGKITGFVNVYCNECDYDSSDEHPSENSLDSYESDYWIENNGTIEELLEKVKVIYDKILGV